MSLTMLALAYALQTAPAQGQDVPAEPGVALSKKAAPLGNPGSWLTPDDYPVPAIRAKEQGVVAFRLDLDATGTPVRCVVTDGVSPTLDAETCRLLLARARFSPALDLQGRKAPSTWRSRIRWELPESGPAPLASGAVADRLLIGTGGKILSCRSQTRGSGEGTASLCDAIGEGKGMPPTLLPLVQSASDANPLVLVFEGGLTFEGLAAIPSVYSQPDIMRQGLIRIDFDVAADGGVANCVERERSGDVDLPFDLCGALPERVAASTPPRPRKGHGWAAVSVAKPGPDDLH